MCRREQPVAVVCGAESSSFEASLGDRARQQSFVHSQSAIGRATYRVTPVRTRISSQSFVQEAVLRYHGYQSMYV